MTLRLDGRDKAVGKVVYYTENGTIIAQKDAKATGAVSLVVQGNDGTNYWYYSRQITPKMTIALSEIGECT